MAYRLFILQEVRAGAVSFRYCRTVLAKVRVSIGLVIYPSQPAARAFAFSAAMAYADSATMGTPCKEGSCRKVAAPTIGVGVGVGVGAASGVIVKLSR